MTDTPKRPSTVVVWLRELRAPFFVASAVPVVVGSAAGFAATGEFHAGLFALALAGVVLLHFAANVANDYFDCRSGADAANRGATVFSGGSRVIQSGWLSPAQVLAGALVLWGLGAASGVAIFCLTGNILLLALMLVGLVGGLAYTAPPARLGYRGFGELAVAVLFGVLPVAGAFAVQAGRFEWWTLAPGAVTGLMVALILFINEFPDEEADRAALKRTLVVRLGRARASRLFLTLLPATWVAAAIAAWFVPPMRVAGILFVATFPLMIFTLRFASTELGKNGDSPSKIKAGAVPIFPIANGLVIALHVVSGLSMAAGFVISGLNR